jgi:iron only hydrogenase large subunit-like protein
MKQIAEHGLVFTVKDRCRVCYTCVRECPVKAIKINNGQAEVIAGRCIGCGNCVKVCSQDAKVFYNSVDSVKELLRGETRVAACVAPSFPAEYPDMDDHRILVGMIRKLGFTLVTEVAFGADLVARNYEELLGDKVNHCISSDCPAIVYYIRHYHPELVPYLAAVASPAMAMARVVKKKYGEDVKLVFIGPCVAKKAESEEFDEVLTFRELNDMFRDQGITPDTQELSEFDPPLSGKGAIFPVTRGKLHTLNKSDNLFDENIISASGRVNFREAIREFEEELDRSQHLELLCCEGCIMGAGMTEPGSRFTKTTCIRNHVRSRMQNIDWNEWFSAMNTYADIDLSRTFEAADRRLPVPSDEKIREVLMNMGKNTARDHLNCGACGYDTCVDHAIAIIEGFAETEMCLPYTIEKLHKSIDELNDSNDKLATAQQSLKQSEKLATMGQLSAGIAHELNNPLGIITMYSNILREECNNDTPMKKDLDLIVEQADRCKKIVSGLLNFARKNQVKHTETDIIRFTQHSIESVIVPDNISVKFLNNLQNPMAFIDRDQWMQVLTNIEKNAIEAMPEGGTLTISLDGDDKEVVFRISDTGSGISKENMDKIFTPFFTTKQPGKGTGLGLPLIYGIVKMHKGQVHVSSNDNPATGPTGTCFTISIPRNKDE